MWFSSLPPIVFASEVGTAKPSVHFVNRSVAVIIKRLLEAERGYGPIISTEMTSKGLLAAVVLVVHGGSWAVF